ncbi:MAG: hypothetical protein JO033_02660 [Acidobacteriaceae bacterium]|nr:hypothetical protein [Acidobacteriaceae bacterium]
MPLGKADPLDDPEFLFELKCDGFRALAVVEYGACVLYSRQGHPFLSFAQLARQIGGALLPRNLVMDGEIVCLDEGGHCQFKICYSDAENHASWRSTCYMRMVSTCDPSN